MTRPHPEIMAEAMGLAPGHRLTGDAISQGVPPCFARYVAEQLLEHLEVERWAA